jgi:hypothetical protein
MLTPLDQEDAIDSPTLDTPALLHREGARGGTPGFPRAVWRETLGGILFQPGDIVRHGDEADEEATES